MRPSFSPLRTGALIFCGISILQVTVSPFFRRTSFSLSYAVTLHLPPQIDFRSYILTIFHTVCYQNFSGLWFFPVGFVLIVVISEVQQFLCVTPFIGFVVGPSTAKEADDKCFALFFPGTYITVASLGSIACFSGKNSRLSCQEMHWHYVQKRFSFL